MPYCCALLLFSHNSKEFVAKYYVATLICNSVCVWKVVLSHEVLDNDHYSLKAAWEQVGKIELVYSYPLEIYIVYNYMIIIIYMFIVNNIENKPNPWLLKTHIHAQPQLNYYYGLINSCC